MFQTWNTIKKIEATLILIQFKIEGVKKLSEYIKTFDNLDFFMGFPLEKYTFI